MTSLTAEHGVGPPKNLHLVLELADAPAGLAELSGLDGRRAGDLTPIDPILFCQL